jgi:hypothetical protein
VLIQWQSPSGDPYVEYGTHITGYSIMIQSGVDSSQFFEDLINCDGSSVTVQSSTSCYVPISVLLGSPYMLSLGSSVTAKIAAVNVIGTSEYSPIGNGAVILMSYAPDAPLNLARNELTTTKT